MLESSNLLPCQDKESMSHGGEGVHEERLQDQLSVAENIEASSRADPCQPGRLWSLERRGSEVRCG